MTNIPGSAVLISTGKVILSLSCWHFSFLKESEFFYVFIQFSIIPIPVFQFDGLPPTKKKNEKKIEKKIAPFLHFIFYPLVFDLLVLFLLCDYTDLNPIPFLIHSFLYKVLSLSFFSKESALEFTSALHRFSFYIIFIKTFFPVIN